MKMKVLASIILASILLLFTVDNTLAQDKSQFTGALLWKVSGKGLSQPSYILGTHHFAHVGFVDSIVGLRDVMNNTQQTVGELIMSEKTAMVAKIQQAAMMPQGETYSKLLSPENYTALDEGLKDMFKVGLTQFGGMHPAMISMMYSMTLYTKAYPEFNPMSHEAIDEYVQRIATEKGKPVSGLETVDDQVDALFNAEPLKDQIDALVCSIKNLEYNVKSVDQLNQFYKSGKLLEMYNLGFNNPEDPCRSSLAQINAINKARNDRWMTNIPEIIKDKSTLIAVGALHLAGEEGILCQLAKLGYTVEPVK